MLPKIDIRDTNYLTVIYNDEGGYLLESNLWLSAMFHEGEIDFISMLRVTDHGIYQQSDLTVQFYK